MSGFLDPLIGGQGQLGDASKNVWQTGQFMPYNLSLPGSNLNFAGNTATGSLQGATQGLYQGMGNYGQGLLNGGGLGYTPANGANFNDTYNTQFQNLMNIQKPWIDQSGQSNRDNEFSKGTLASTAGGYQTAGHDMAINSLMGQNANQAFGQAMDQTKLQEQQAEFGPQMGTSQLNGFFNNMLGANNQLSQQLGLGANIGAARSAANTNAAMPGIDAARQGDAGRSGFLNSLLFGNGSGGLLDSILGSYGDSTSSGNGMGGLASDIYNSLLGRGGVTSGSLASATAPSFAGLGASTGSQLAADGSAITAGNDAYLGSNIGGYLGPSSAGGAATGGLGAGAAGGAEAGIGAGTAAAGAGDAGLTAIGTGAVDEAGAASAASASGALGGSSGGAAGAGLGATLGVGAAAAGGLYAALDSYGAFGDHPDAQTVAFNNYLKGSGTQAGYLNPNGSVSQAGSNIGSHKPTVSYGAAQSTQKPVFTTSTGQQINPGAKNSAGATFDPNRASQLYNSGNMQAYQSYLQQFTGSSSTSGIRPILRG